MSLLGWGQKPQPSSSEKIEMAEAEITMMNEMMNRLTRMCAKKCIPTDYREGELNKGESVCLDRCAGKFFEAHMKVSEMMTEISAQGQMSGNASSTSSGGGGGFFGGR